MRVDEEDEKQAEEEEVQESIEAKNDSESAIENDAEELNLPEEDQHSPSRKRKNSPPQVVPVT